MFDEVRASCGGSFRAAAIFQSAHVLQTHVLRVRSFIVRDARKSAHLRVCECFDFRRLQWLAGRDSIDV
jgi:hypothetical protein